MKKILSATCAMMLASAGMMANAQQEQTQLPNGNFDGTWVDCMPDGSHKVGLQPNGWMASSVYKKVFIFTVELPLVFQDENYTGASENAFSVKMENLFAESMGVGANAPGYITLGTSWAYGDITNVSNPEKDTSDGGAYGGIQFEYRPDALSLWVKRTHGTENPDERASVIFYSWKGHTTSRVKTGLSNAPVEIDMVDREKDVLGMIQDGVTKSKDFELISKSENYVESDIAEWKQVTYPIDYLSNGTPEKINVILSSSDYFNRKELGLDNKFWVDDVKFIYYSRLASISLNNEAITLKEGQYDYPVDKVLDFSKEKVEYTLEGEGQTAKVDVSVDTEEALVTVIVSNEYGTDTDGKSSHTYRFQYNKKETYYSSQLASLKVNDVAVNGFSSDVYSYYVAGEVPAIEDVKAVAVDPEATVEMTRDEEAATITIVVTNPKGVDEDGESSHTYVLNFQKFYTPAGQEYNGDLTIANQTISGESVFIDDAKNDGTCTFGLYKFSLGGEVLGDIVVENVAMDTDENGNITYNGEKKDIVLFLNGSPIFADATVTGTEDAAGNLKMTIPVIWKSGIGEAEPVTTINVTFEGRKAGTSGVESVAGDGVKVYAAAGCVVVEGAEGVAQVYTADGKQVAAEAVNGKTEIALANGLYIVRVGNKVQKVVVK